MLLVRIHDYHNDKFTLKASPKLEEPVNISTSEVLGYPCGFMCTFYSPAKPYFALPNVSGNETLSDY